MDRELSIKQVKISKLKPYKNNAKIHTEKQIKQIMHSITECGFNDPIACDEKGVIIEGHGRYEAAKRLHMKTIPTIILRGLSSTQKKAYILAHNKLTMDTGFDLEILTEELNSIEDSGFDMSSFGFDVIGEIDVNDLFEEVEEQHKTKGKIYEIVIVCDDEQQMHKRLKKLQSCGWDCKQVIK